jgi:hypothetical protein
MPRSDITRTAAPGSRASAGSALTFLTGDPANNHRIKATGREMLLVRNSSGTTAYPVTVLSTPDPNNRKGDITSQMIPANGFAIFGPWDIAGWSNNGYIEVNITNAALLLAVIVLP